MNSKQEDKLSMLIVVVSYLATLPASIINQMPGWEVLYVQCTEILQKLRALKQGQSMNRKGFRMTKGNYREIMVAEGFITAARIKAYALSINDMVLWNEMDFKPYQFERMRDSDVADTCSAIYDKANSLLTDLAPYGVTTATQFQFNNTIDNYNSYLPMPRAGVVTKKEITESIKLTFESLDTVLTSMDTLATMLKFSEPKFFKSYFSSRKIVESGSRVIAIRGFVTNKEGAPLKKVVVTIEELEGMFTTTTARGYYQYKNLPDGVFTFTFSRAGYAPYKVPIAVTKSLRVEYDVTLSTVDDIGRMV